MKLGIVTGVIWASKKVKELDGCRMYILQPIAVNGSKTDTPLVAADPKNIASAGDRVVYVTSTDAAQAFETGYAPVNASIVALVDEIS
jgi:microcompartment protein CcmK/EutM